MKRSLLPLIALALAAGACSSNVANLPSKSVAAVPAGTLQTAWGELPTYQAERSMFPFALDRKRPGAVPREFRPGDTAVLDFLVDRNGSIRDVKIHTSSGSTTVDNFLMNRFVGARSLLQVAATDVAPYVIRQTFSLGNVSPYGDGQISSDSDSKYSDIRPMGTGAKHPADH